MGLDRPMDIREENKQDLDVQMREEDVGIPATKRATRGKVAKGKAEPKTPAAKEEAAPKKADIKPKEKKQEEK